MSLNVIVARNGSRVYKATVDATVEIGRRLCKAKVVGLNGELDLFELMPADSQQNAELAAEYTKALELFESGQHFRESVRAFSELVQRFPTDGPSLMMLVRSVSELVESSTHFSPVWCAKSK